MAASALDRLAELRVMPVVEVPDPALALPLADALRAGGIPAIEVTFRTPAAAAAIEAIAGARPDLLVAAGTVLSPEQASLAVRAGAGLVISPGIDLAVVDRCLELAVGVLPGVATPTEVLMALGRGLDAAKFFPAEAAGGPAYLGALAGPFRGFRFAPSGGIGPDNAARYLALPSVIAVGTSWVAAPGLLAARDLAEVERRAREMVARLDAPTGTPAAPAAPR